MGDEWEQDNGSEPGSGQPYQDDLDKRIEEIRRKVIEGTSEAQQRIKRVVESIYRWWNAVPAYARETSAISKTAFTAQKSCLP